MKTKTKKDILREDYNKRKPYLKSILLSLFVLMMIGVCESNSISVGERLSGGVIIFVSIIILILILKMEDLF